ncbi:hypothetical protein [Paraburkholderia sp. J8-2]|uniref:hypothetical protein n=1 Tax=Paraburkholderia sp. J8-2 TaxID=2805440 RepID=UPI002AB5FD5A|nr:hypothetical protein [Paraburkholderia sp. J8-2]
MISCSEASANQHSGAARRVHEESVGQLPVIHLEKNPFHALIHPGAQIASPVEF